MTSRANVGRRPMVEPVPLSPAAALIRSRIALRREDLEEFCPDAIDVAAELTASIHQALHGEATAHRGDRTPRFWRGVLTGDHELGVCDLARLSIERPDAVRPAVSILALTLGCRLESLGAAVGSIAAEAADVVESGSRLGATVLRAPDGDVYTPAEIDELLRQLAEHKREVVELETAIARERGRG